MEIIDEGSGVLAPDDHQIELVVRALWRFVLIRVGHNAVVRGLLQVLEAAFVERLQPDGGVPGRSIVLAV